MLVDTINMVYFDQLIESIDNSVEKTDDYNAPLAGRR